LIIIRWLIFYQRMNEDNGFDELDDIFNIIFLVNPVDKRKLANNSWG